MPQENSEAPLTKAIDYRDGDALFEGYAVIPQPAAAKRPCVVLTHEWSGLNEGMKRLAERYAGLGYICFALDVYGKGIRGDQAGDNTHLMHPLLGDRALLRRRLLAPRRRQPDHVD